MVDADYDALANAASVATQMATDQAFNLTILGTATNGGDESHLTAWVGTTAYTTSNGLRGCGEHCRKFERQLHGDLRGCGHVV